MSKRRISHQQSQRIKKIQENYHSNLDGDSSLPSGLVLVRYSRHAEVEDEQGNRIHCSIRPHIDSLVAGDRVVWQAEGVGQGVIVSRYPRDSMLGRPDKHGDPKPIAANITQIMVVVAPLPELTWSLLDSYLVMAEYLSLKLCIILNKVDLPCEQLQKELLELYPSLGYPVLLTTKQNNQGYEQLKKALDQNISVFVGQSGVGKSSLISGVLPHEADIQTASISETSGLGCHTTRNSRLYHIPSGGMLIDSPGIRELGLWQLPASEVAKAYREFRPFLANCKFRNCDHHTSPGCAIIEALSQAQITQRRYDNFIKIITKNSN